MTASLFAGAAFGLGLLLVLRGWVPAKASLAEALASIHPVAVPVPIVTATRAQSRWLTVAGQVALRWTTGLGLRSMTTASDLRILDRSLERHYAEKVLLALFGLALPSATAIVLIVGGVSLPLAIPLWASALLAVGGFFIPDLGIRSDADERRRDFRHALTSYLDLVVIALAGGGGVESALTAAAATGHGWAFDHLRRALDTARVRREAPWVALGQLGAELNVPELAELSASLGLAGTEGARIRQSVAAKAAALRAHLLSEAETEAQAASERMSLPVVLLFAGFLLFVGFPAVAQVATNL